MKTLIIGYGNTLRGDDAIGLLAIEALENTGLPPEIELLTCLQLTPELAEELAFCDRAIFICASVRGEYPAGTINKVEFQPSSVDHSTIDNEFDISRLLAIAQILYGHYPRTVQFAVSAEQIDIPGILSGPVEMAFPSLIKQIMEWAIP
jgi:hydrogenase maturation protease